MLTYALLLKMLAKNIRKKNLEYLFLYIISRRFRCIHIVTIIFSFSSLEDTLLLEFLLFLFLIHSFLLLVLHSPWILLSRNKMMKKRKKFQFFVFFSMYTLHTPSQHIVCQMTCFAANKIVFFQLIFCFYFNLLSSIFFQVFFFLVFPTCFSLSLQCKMPILSRSCWFHLVPLYRFNRKIMLFFVLLFIYGFTFTIALLFDRFHLFHPGFFFYFVRIGCFE